MPEDANTIRSIAIVGTVQRILEREANGRSDQQSRIQAAEGVIAKLRMHLSKSIGQEGFRTLLARALNLAKITHPCMSALTIEPDASLLGLRAAADSSIQEIRSSEKQQDIVEGAIAIIANFFELLSTLIGDELTLRILSTVWTELGVDGSTGWENQGL